MGAGKLVSQGLGRARLSCSVQEGDLRDPQQPGWWLGLSMHRTLGASVGTLASSTESKGASETSTVLPSVPEKFSSALQPGALLDLLQVEGMKIEEESEVRRPLTPLP